MANSVTIELKILTAKAGSNVKALAKQTGELKISMDSATQSIRRNRDEQGRFVPQTQKTTDVVDDQGKAYDRLKQQANKTFGKAGLVSLYAGAGLAAGAMYNRTISRGRDFQQQLADLEAITGITGDQLQELGEDALDLSIEYGETASNIIEANKLVASQLAEKIDFGTAEGAAELAKVSEEAIVLQKAAGVDLPTAVKTLTTAINQFNLPASESARLINSIAAGSKFGAAEVGNQAEAYKQAGSVAAGANLSFEELNATVQVLAANAIVGGQAGTNIRGILLSLQNAAKLAEAGVQDVSLETHGYTGTLEALKPVLEDTVALEKLFGRENIASARILIQNAASVEEMTEKVTGGNVAYEQAAIQLDTYNGAASKLSAAIDAQLIPAFLEQGGATVQLMNWTTDLIQEFSGGISVINNWLDAFSDAREEMKLTSGITSIQIRSIADLRKELAAAAEQGELNASQEKELRDAYEATNEQLFNSITPLQQKINQQIAERSGLEQRLELLKENLGWEEKSNEELLNSQSAAGELVKEIQALNMQIGNNQEQVSKLIQEYQAGQVSFEEFLDTMNASNEVTEAQSESVETLGTQFKNNKDRIDELVSSINELSLAEFNELQSLTAQNEAIQEQINKRKELAGLGQDLRPEVDNPEPISIPIELDTTELDRMVDEGLINLDVPLQSIDDILSELNKDVAQYVEMSELLGDHTDDMDFAMRRTEQAMQDLIDNGYHPQSAEIQNLIAQLQELQDEYQRTEEVNYLANFAGEQLAGAITGMHQVSNSLEAQKDRIRDRAEADKAAAKTASDRARIEARAQEEISQAESQAKDRRKQILRESITASITEAAIVQFGKVIKTIPFPLNVIMAPIAAAAVSVGMDKLMNFNTGGVVPGSPSETKDTVPAILTPGEFVVRKDSANAAPTALRAMNEQPIVAAQVERYISTTNIARTQSNLVRTAIETQSETDRVLRPFNSGGLVMAGVSQARMNGIISRESNPAQKISISSGSNVDRLVDEIRTQTDAIKKMKVEAEVIFSDFKEAYEDFAASESELGR